MGAVRSLHLHRPAHLYQYTTFSPLCRYLQPIDLITRGTEDSEGRHVNRWGLCVCSWGRWCSSACCWHTACLHAEVQARHVSPTCSAAACYCTAVYSRVKTVAGSLDMLDSFCSGLSGSMATWADTCGSELACVEPQPQRRGPSAAQLHRSTRPAWESSTAHVCTACDGLHISASDCCCHDICS